MHIRTKAIVTRVKSAKLVWFQTEHDPETTMVGRKRYFQAKLACGHTEHRYLGGRQRPARLACRDCTGRPLTKKERDIGCTGCSCKVCRGTST